MNKKKNILVIGASGFVGRALTKKLLGTGHNIFLTSRDEKFRCRGARVYFGDIFNGKFCNKILRGIDVVYYLAGYKENVLGHTERPFDFILGNVRPMLSFLDALRRSHATRMIYLSSVLVDYVLEQGEEIDGYASGKYINELILRSFAKQSRINIKIIRSVSIYGPGDNFNQETANLIPALIEKVAQARRGVTIWGNGKRRMQFIYIDDLVANLLAVGGNYKSDFYIFGNPETASVKEIVEKIKQNIK